jgi:hypothetical protein
MKTFPQRVLRKLVPAAAVAFVATAAGGNRATVGAGSR